ncbi:11723_t:CDS:10 [Funneliformis caledonium]|uniref:11723_t:CDS:1 n=1 Tax=Funneliformis caledonium TaxID=1117310 RepID=A0A9N8VF83_9GLOM|nr:11723_t:CDS:10 [Funneliformis caledonium]
MGATKRCLVVQHERWPARSDSLMSPGQIGCWLKRLRKEFTFGRVFACVAGGPQPCLIVQHKRVPSCNLKDCLRTLCVSTYIMWLNDLHSNEGYQMSKFAKFVLDTRFCQPHTGINKFFSVTSLNWWNDIKKFTRLVYASDPTVTAQQNIDPDVVQHTHNLHKNIIKTEYLKIIGDTLMKKIHDDSKKRKRKTIRTRKNFQTAKSNDIENRRTAVYNDSYDLNAEINNFFQSSHPSNLFFKRDNCSKCFMEINISELLRFCSYCGSKIVLSDDVNELESDEDGSVKSDCEADENKDDNDLPKINKLAFREVHNAIPDTAKMHLKSGKIVEDVLFDFAKDMEHEQALFTEAEWNELTEDRIRFPAVPHEIAKELMRYRKTTLSELRNSVMTSYLQDGTIYNINKHYDQEWIQMAFTAAFFGTCIDFCMRDIQLGTDIKRTDAPSLASANRKNRGRSGNTNTRKLTGRKIDGIVYIVDRLIEVGAIEAARSFLGVSDQKYLLETFKMPKTLRDIYADLVRTANYEDRKANNIQVFGILHLGLWIQFARLWRAGGSVCIFRKDPVSHHVDSKFSEDGIKSFLKLMAAIYQHKLIIRNNLQTLNIRNTNIEPTDEDFLNELLEVGDYSASPTSNIFFADSWPTPRKKRKNSKKKNARKMRKL